MKRFFTMLLLLVVVGCAAHADEITFRGIPWAVSLIEFHEALGAEGIAYKRDDTGTRFGSFENKGYFSFAGVQPEWYFEEIPSLDVKYKSIDDSPLCYVGGYAVDFIYATFLPHCSNDETKIYASDEYSSLVRASYQLYGKNEAGKYVEYDKVFEDLEYKLTALYGPPTGDETFALTGTYTKYWIADDLTAVSLSKTSIGISGWIKIEYAYANEKDFIEKLDRVVKYQRQLELENGLDNVDGL